MKKNSLGFSFAAILVLLASIGVIIGVAYVAYDRFFSDYLEDSSKTVESDVVTAEDLPEAPQEVTDTSDLDEVVNTLDSVDLDVSQLDTLESELDSF